ncbi:DnaB helicase C-terminal domain-containing protein [Anaerobacillus alkalidiazotrophicus]|nr:DnaB helicase C-terminal domain-containing protein [Anaerobacillus alkalidiazotrophicus]
MRKVKFTALLIGEINSTPSISQLRERGSIEQTSDIIILSSS